MATEKASEIAFSSPRSFDMKQMFAAPQKQGARKGSKKSSQQQQQNKPTSARVLSARLQTPLSAFCMSEIEEGAQQTQPEVPLLSRKAFFRQKFFFHIPQRGGAQPASERKQTNIHVERMKTMSTLQKSHSISTTQLTRPYSSKNYVTQTLLAAPGALQEQALKHHKKSQTRSFQQLQHQSTQESQQTKKNTRPTSGHPDLYLHLQLKYKQGSETSRSVTEPNTFRFLDPNKGNL